MPGRIVRPAAVLGIAGALAGATFAQPAASAAPQARAAARHVLLISVDGLHQSDLAWYVARNPQSALARLVNGGVDYTDASTTEPSDSFPGMVAQVTGGGPGTTGVYYDDTYDAALLPAGTTQCKGARPGAEVDLTEDLDRDKASIDAGQGLKGLPGSILSMTGRPESLIDPARLPVDPRTCKPVPPHSYLQVNTVFEVARKAGLRTAWSDKHAAYDILNGPSGTGIQDLFTPEINSDAPGYPAGGDWTTDNKATQQYDGYKVRAVLNEIDGYDHSRTRKVGTPAVFGLNLQSVSTAQKLPASDGLGGGYTAENVPGPLLAENLAYVDAQVGALTAEIGKRHLAGSTTVILSAKHGQSPTDPAALTRIDDGPLLDGLNAAWKKLHPGAADLVVHAVDDDAMLLWLSDRSAAATSFAQRYLLAQSGTGTDIGAGPKAYTRGGLSEVYAGAAAARHFGVRPGDPRVPDVYGVAQYGVVYTGGTSKVAEHGGAHADDLNVPAGGLRRLGPARGARRGGRADEADRADDSRSARPGPPLASGCARGTHGAAAPRLTRNAPPGALAPGLPRPTRAPLPAGAPYRGARNCATSPLPGRTGPAGPAPAAMSPDHRPVAGCSRSSSPRLRPGVPPAPLIRRRRPQGRPPRAQGCPQRPWVLTQFRNGTHPAERVRNPAPVGCVPSSARATTLRPWVGGLVRKGTHPAERVRYPLGQREAGG